LKAVCTWGDGPDVILCLDGTPLVLLENPDLNNGQSVHGVVTKGDVDLTADQAYKLGFQLINAAQQAKKLYEGIRGQDEKRNSGNDR